MQKFKLLLLGLIVIGSLLGSFHHHPNGLSSSDCQVCVIQHNLDISGDIDTYSLVSIDTYIDTLVLSDYCYNNTLIYHYTLSRAPPSFS